MSLTAFVSASKTDQKNETPVEAYKIPKGDGEKKKYWWLMPSLLIILFLIGKNTEFFSKKLGVKNETVTQQVVVAPPVPSLELEEIFAEGTSAFLSVEKYSTLLLACNEGRGDTRACSFLAEYHERNGIQLPELVPGFRGNISEKLFKFLKSIGITRVSQIYAIGEAGLIAKGATKKLVNEARELVRDSHYNVSTWEGETPEPQNIRLNDLEAAFVISDQLYDILSKIARNAGEIQDLESVWALISKNPEILPEEFVPELNQVLRDFSYPQIVR